MARVLILRHRPDAEDTAAALQARGHTPLVLPLGAVAALDVPCPDGPFAGFVVTSANAVPALAARFPGDGRPILAVGSRTAEALATAGFTNVTAGRGDAADLVLPAAALSRKTGRALLYAAGATRMPDFERALAEANVPLTIWTVYDIAPAAPSAAAVAAAFDARPDAVLLLSVGQAKGFAALLKRVLAPRCLDTVPRLLCLSERIRNALPDDLRPSALISPQPKLSSLFDRFL